MRAAITQADDPSSRLHGLCVAYAEISATAPTIIRTQAIDWEMLARCREPTGFAIRVREFPGEVLVDREPFPTLCGSIEELLKHANAAGLRPAEIEIDFDCPTSRLRGFVKWMGALQQRFSRQKFRFTALPAWLHSRDFASLANATGGYVLQLHALTKPGPDGAPARILCDPSAARAAVERAAQLGVPFRAALPTYGYRMVLDAQGRLLAAAGEGAAMETVVPPPGGSSRVLMANASELADLVAGWRRDRPQALRGVIWYRLPVAGERLNWAPRTFASVMAGRRPQARLSLRFQAADPVGLWDLRVTNDGDADAPLPGSIAVRCPATPIAADGAGGFVMEEDGPSQGELIFSSYPTRGKPDRVVAVGESIPFGWVRLERGDAAPVGSIH